MNSLNDALGPWPSPPVASFEDVNAALLEVDEAISTISVALGIALGPNFFNAMIQAANLLSAADAEEAEEAADEG